MRNNLFHYDFFRYFGTAPSFGKVLPKLIRYPELHFLYHFRKSTHRGCRLVRLYHRTFLTFLSRLLHIQIPLTTSIGPGFYLGHFGRVIIHPSAIIGRNVNIATGVTLGVVPNGSRAGTPKIGDFVWIGTNSVIVGGISVGRNVVIAPGAFVNFDVPDNCIVLGNPGLIKPAENATQGYLLNLI